MFEWLMALVLLLMFNLLFVILKYINDYKLRRNGYSAFVNSLKDELHIRKVTNIESLAKEKDAFGLYNHYKPSRFHSVNVNTLEYDRSVN